MGSENFKLTYKTQNLSQIRKMVLIFKPFNKHQCVCLCVCTCVTGDLKSTLEMNI